MQYSLTVDGFEGRQLVLETAGLVRAARLLQDGEPAPRGAKRGMIVLRRNDGRVVEARFKQRALGFDPIPGVEIDGTVFAPAPLRWFQWLWLSLPLLLIFAGGAIGGLLGILAVRLSARVFRSSRSGRTRYALTATISLAAVLISVVAVAALGAATSG